MVSSCHYCSHSIETHHLPLLLAQWYVHTVHVHVHTVHIHVCTYIKPDHSLLYGGKSNHPCLVFSHLLLSHARTHTHTHTRTHTHTHTHTHTLTQTRTDTVWTCWHQRFPSSSSSWSTWQRMRTDQMVSLLAVQVYWGRSSIATVHQIHITLCTCETF